MQTYANGFMIVSICSSCFIDAESTASRMAKWATGIFAVLFVVTEAIAVVGV